MVKKDNSARREATVGEPSQSSHSKAIIARNHAARAMRARNANPGTHRIRTRVYHKRKDE